ncbi:MAG: zinc-dependent peptidase [Flavobacteriales bacterium]|jgi:hypothetical protein|nr:zinc-dependent peptidase [Flavobacteriales bacterium]
MLYQSLIEQVSDDHLLADCWFSKEDHIKQVSVNQKDIDWIIGLMEKDPYYQELNPALKKNIKPLVLRIEQSVVMVHSTRKDLPPPFRLYLAYQLSKALIARTDFPLSFINSIVIYSGVKLRKQFSEAGLVDARGPMSLLFLTRKMEEILGYNLQLINNFYLSSSIRSVELLKFFKKWEGNIHFISKILSDNEATIKPTVILKKIAPFEKEINQHKTTYLNFIERTSLKETDKNNCIELYNYLTTLYSYFINRQEQLTYKNQTSIHLSWFHLISSYKTLQSELMIHEFAHVLDYYSTGLDGLAISNKQQQEIWKNNYREEEAKGNASIISEYGLSNPYEFFAVSSELFFTEQDRLKQHLPQLFSSLQKIYGYMPPNQKKLTTWQYYKLLFFSKVSLFKLP